MEAEGYAVFADIPTLKPGSLWRKEITTTGLRDRGSVSGRLIKIEQTRSPIRRRGNKRASRALSRSQRATLIGLNLNRIGRTARPLDTPQARGMITKVRHLLFVTELRPLARRRFEALAGYTRDPKILELVEEIEWYATPDERLLGVIVHDRMDYDYGWVVLARDERLRFRAIDVGSSLATREITREQLLDAAHRHYQLSDATYYQGDAEGPPTDFFKPIAPEERLHRTFKILSREERYSPARELVRAMMRFYEDADGNFIEQFQTTAFDARIWELYLFAAFTELGYAPASSRAVPDFLFGGVLGALGIEATSVNPPDIGEIKPPNDKAQLIAYMENYIPIKLARVLKRKLEKRNPYWEVPEMRSLPFVIAVQDFHSPGSMQMITSAMIEYAFGFRHSIVDGQRRIEKIEEHVWGHSREKSGFFRLPKSENVSAIIVNPQGTLPKFNRMGFLAEFGNKKVRMLRAGIARGERNPENPMPVPFQQMVHGAGYNETWVEGMVVLHNPHALIDLHPAMIPGAAHEFLQPDGKIMSLIPDFHPVFSRTQIWVA